MLFSWNTCMTKSWDKIDLRLLKTGYYQSPKPRLFKFVKAFDLRFEISFQSPGVKIESSSEAPPQVTEMSTSGFVRDEYNSRKQYYVFSPLPSFYVNNGSPPFHFFLSYQIHSLLYHMSSSTFPFLHHAWFYPREIKKIRYKLKTYKRIRRGREWKWHNTISFYLLCIFRTCILEGKT